MNLVEARWGSDQPSDYEEIAEVEWREESYEFDLTRVYQHRATGDLFYAEDSGCSCPSPFEDTQVSDLQPITRMQDWYDHVAARTVASDPDQEYQYPGPTPPSAIDQAEAARRAIHAAIAKQEEVTA